MGLDDLISLGPCLVSVLPINYLKNISSSVFVSYFPTLGISFQPDDSQIKIIQSLISKLTTSVSSQDNFVFSTLSDLALFYNFSSPYANSLTYVINFCIRLKFLRLKSLFRKWTSSGTSLMNIINNARNPSDPSVQICQLGLTNSNSIQNLIRNYGSILITKLKTTFTTSQRKRASNSLTCDQLNSLSGSLNQLSTADIASIDLNEFYTCQSLLGLTSNSWSTSQLTQLANIAKMVKKDFDLKFS